MRLSLLVLLDMLEIVLQEIYSNVSLNQIKPLAIMNVVHYVGKCLQQYLLSFTHDIALICVSMLTVTAVRAKCWLTLV